MVELLRNDFLELGGKRTTARLGFFTMDDGGKGIHWFGIHEHLQLHELCGFVASLLVVHRTVASGNGFHFIHKIDEDFVKREVGCEHDALGVDGLGVAYLAAFFHDELQDGRDVFIREHHEAAHHRFADFLDHTGVGELVGIIDAEDFAIRALHLVNDRGVGRDDVHVELAAETLYDDLHVQQT